MATEGSIQAVAPSSGRLRALLVSALVVVGLTAGVLGGRALVSDPVHTSPAIWPASVDGVRSAGHVPRVWVARTEPSRRSGGIGGDR